ncbi:hypothetical protein HN51_004148 [Arachis hypogaea]|uniref:Protein kinase domain-containing protein n=2 Tax=Arachis TaxID=3817 RepID=A0A444WNV0_ARAHY|nr:wall-associated receptor kinase-like 1 [Arachis duranensis]XP_025694345.1 wall-associated receptor kinase-like 1 [Arachis hypogaea]QHO37862.1 Wall-associated receptor kinase-like [Arachis hypogaea]RYQ79189.1 hypothetical protein Ahy_Scaffold6g107896 isoform A [Arachis hypogaea]RYQ79190.1 hypothetical protein Ahy_Scaffold6g107896 isoform B [Arachis hypogaea]
MAQKLSEFLIIFFIICPLFLLFLASAQNDYPITSQSDCVSTCGSIEIPYPFGMKDPKCYADKWFEIECRNQKPYLKLINLEVTGIYASSSMVEIMNPVFRWKCKDDKDSKPFVNLTGTPFSYSNDQNKFTAIGCNKIAFLVSNGLEVSGCVTLCDQHDNEEVNSNVAYGQGTDGCLGRFCCETSLPLYLSEFNVTLESMNNRSSSDECVHALIGTDYWYEIYDGTSTEYRSLGDLRGLNYVRAMLDWVILNNTVKLPSDSNCTHVVGYSSSSSSARRCECYSDSFGNPYVTGGCIDFDSSNKNSRAKWVIIGVSASLGSIILLLGLWFMYIVVRRRILKKRKEKFFKQNGGLLLQQRLSTGEVSVEQAKVFSLRELEKATDNFNLNRVLGKGGQGTVYKGMLVNGEIVAVKRFKVQGKVEEFINEFVILSQINHRNVVKLLGCCLETEIPLLVYEFIPNGNLFEYLHDQNEELPVTWDMRLRISIEVAGALFYLHSIAYQPIYHRDVKSTNILLDGKYRAKLADFGASRIISTEATHLTTVVQGTFGYLDPEYFHTSQFTEKSDVYSFGVVLVELLTGEKPISSIREEDAKSLASYFVGSMEQDCLFEIVDKRVMKEGEQEQIIGVANLAYRCLELNGRKRPTMKEVTLELERIRNLDRKVDDLVVVVDSQEQYRHEEIEFVGTEMPWTGDSELDTLPSIGNNTTSSEIRPIHAKYN